MCLAIAELAVQWKFITLGLLGPGTNTELGSGANKVCLVVTELSGNLFTLGTLRPCTNAELGSDNS